MNLKKLKKNESKAEFLKEIPPLNKIPAIKIGRYAIDKKYVKKGLGSEILVNIIKNIEEISETTIGLRFITVDAYVIAYKFYKKNKFKHFKIGKVIEKIDNLEKIIKTDPESTILMYLDIKRIY